MSSLNNESSSHLAPADHQLDCLLTAWQSGDRAAAETLFEVLYPELKRLASRHLRRARPITWGPTDLLHEAYLRMERTGAIRAENRLQFFGAAARIVRHALVDRLRVRGAQKRDGGRPAALLNPDQALIDGLDIDLLALDEALRRLAEFDPDSARVVELRYFSGFTLEETSKVLAIGTATVSRRWQMAKAWLRRELQR